MRFYPRFKPNPAMPILYGLAFLCLLALNACDTSHHLRLQGEAQGTTWQIDIADADKSVATPQLQQGLEKILQSIDKQMSTWRTDSELSQFNQTQSTDWFPVSSDLYQVLVRAQQVSAETNGAFDVTIAPLMQLWGFGKQTELAKKPSADAIQTTLIQVGYRKLELQAQPMAIRKQIPNLQVDVAGIAQGYTIDCLAAYLEQQGIQNYLVELGGELRAKGLNNQHKLWHIAIEKPSESLKQAQQGVLLNNAALTTAGDYRDFFEQQGKRYSHTIEPHTGNAVSHSLASVSVLANNAVTADAYDTALMAMGNDAQAFAEQHQLAAYFIWRTEQGFRTYATPTFKQALLP
jgi:thiamine biosynthesis lipoprotein